MVLFINHKLLETLYVQVHYTQANRYIIYLVILHTEINIHYYGSQCNILYLNDVNTTAKSTEKKKK